MASKEGQTIKQLRGQISALVRENKMLNQKMSLLEQNTTLKQNAMLSSFLTWMEKGESHHHERDSKSPTPVPSVKQEPISAEPTSRPKDPDNADTFSTGSTRKKSPDVRNYSFNSEPDRALFDRSSKKEVPSDAGFGQSLAETCLSESPDALDNRSKEKSSTSRCNDFGVGLTTAKTPAEIPFRTYENSIPSENDPRHVPLLSHYRPYFVHENELAIAASPDIRDYWLRRHNENRDLIQESSSPITSTPKKPNPRFLRERGADDYNDLKDRVGSLLEETRRAANPDVGAFPDDDHAIINVDLEQMTSTPAKTPQKRVVFADEMDEDTSRSRDPVSSVPRPYNCDPLNLFTPMRRQGSASRHLSYPVDLSPSADGNNFVDSQDEHSLRRLHDRTGTGARRRSGTSKRPMSSRKDERKDGNSKKKSPRPKDKSPRSKGAHENYSAKRDSSYDAEMSPRPSVNVDKFFDSRSRANGILNPLPVLNAENAEHQENCRDDHTCLSGGSRSKRSRYEGVTKVSPGLTAMPKSPFQIESQGPQTTSFVDFSTSNDEKTIEILENELQDIYKQNLDDEIKITEIRRNAVRRFDNWRDAMESEMTKLEKDGRERLVRNLDLLSQSLPACLKCDCSTGFDGNSRSVAVSEGRLSELEDRSGLEAVHLEKSRDESFDRTATEKPLQKESLSPKVDKARNLSIDSQTESPRSVFMAHPDTIIFGEIAFQLERVILSRVFRGGSKQLSGYTLSNMEKMIQSHYDYRERPMLKRQLDEVKGELHICGWNHDFHPKLVAHLIKKFGTFPTNVKAKSAARKRGWTEPQALKEEVLWRIPKKYIHDMIILLDCLFYLSKKYDIPLFTW